MKWIAVPALAFSLALAGCGSSGKSSATEQKLQQQADYWAIDQIERTWHRAASTHNLDLMMSIWAPNATFTINGTTYTVNCQVST